ncbi:50S ribosomal protein L1 [Candidatus Dependentiae bacterium]|nr:50S ribosomal protein L1 [Candidatus Dependentiae bacterium]
MAKHGKKYLKAVEQVQKSTILAARDAINKVKELRYVSFDESVDVHVNLGIDASKGDQVVRGSVVLPHGKGKKARVLVFAKGDHADEAKKAGADYVGADDLVEKISAGWMDFEYAVATPDLMGIVGKVAKILGPRGLLPNKKVGTVTFEVGATVEELKKGKVFFKNDKQGLVHFSFGKVSFDAQKLQDNLATFVKALMAAKPATSKGKFIKKLTLSSTMGVGIQVNPDEFLRA